MPILLHFLTRFDFSLCSIAEVLIQQTHQELLEQRNPSQLDQQAKLAKYQEAISLLSQAHTIYQASCGSDHPKTKQSQGRLTFFRSDLPHFEWLLQLAMVHGPDDLLSTRDKQKHIQEFPSYASQIQSMVQSTDDPDRPKTQRLLEGISLLGRADSRSRLESGLQRLNAPLYPSSNATQHHIRVGARIRVRGLVSTPQHNRCRGVVESFDGSKQRYGVWLDNGKGLSLKPACLLQMAEVELGNAGHCMIVMWVDI